MINEEPHSPQSELPALVQQELRSKNYLRRTEACAALEDKAQGGNPAVIQALLDRLSDDHPQVREAAARALAAGPAAVVIPGLLDQVANTRRSVRPGHRASLMFALGLSPAECHGPVCETLLDNLDHTDQDVRFQALVALNRIGCSSDRFRQALIHRLDDTDDEVAAVAATVAADFRMHERLPLIVERWRRAQGFAQRHLALAAALMGSEEVIGTLERCVRATMDGLEAIDALVALSSQAAGNTLHTLALSWRVHPLLRGRAGVALAQVGHPQAGEVIARHLDHRKDPIRWATIEWLGRLDRREYIERLTSILADGGHRDSAEAAFALGLMEPSGAVRQALESAAGSDPRIEVHQAAQAALDEHEQVAPGETQTSVQAHQAAQAASDEHEQVAPGETQTSMQAHQAAQAALDEREGDSLEEKS